MSVEYNRPLVILLYLIDTYGEDEARSRLLSASCNHDSIDMLITLGVKKLLIPVDNNITNVIDYFQNSDILDECINNIAHIASYFERDIFYRKVLEEFILNYDYNTVTKLSYHNIYFLFKRVVQVFVNKLYWNLEYQNKIKHIDIKTLEELVIRLSFNEICNLSNIFEECSSSDDIKKFNDDMKCLLNIIRR